MEEWKEYKYIDLCSLIGGGTPKTSESSYWGGEIPWLSVKDFGTDRKYVYTTEKTITKEGLENSSTKLLQKDDIIISARGTIGAMAMIVCPMAFNQSCFGIRGNELVDKDFLYYLTKTKIAELQKNSHGSVFETITRDTFAKLNCNIPTLKKQKDISFILSSLDNKIEVNRRINDNLEQQAQALFKSWFVDFEPFKDGEFIESELGMIPKGWRVGTVYEYIDVIYGAPYKSSLFNEDKDGLPLIRIRDLKTNAPQFYTPEILPNTEYIEAGDIVAGMDAEFIPYVWLGEKGVLNQRCCKFKAKNDAISNYYVLFLIKPKLEYVQSYKTGTTVSHLGKNDIDKFKFITPSIDVVLAFSKIVSPLIKEVVNRAKESRRLPELRDTLLPRLMSGELKVNEINM